MDRCQHHDGDETGEGRAFPSEAEWLDLPAPPIAPGFVERTLEALGALGPQAADGDPETEGEADGAHRGIAGQLLTPQLLAQFAAPEPSADFVARTTEAVRRDRLARWRELLARHVAPEPSPQFVARTLQALADDRAAAPPTHSLPTTGAPWHGRRVWRRLLLAVAAGAAVVALLARAPLPPLERRIADAVPAAFAHAHAASPLPAVLTVLDHAADPQALPLGSADGTWLLLHGRERGPGGRR